jgi:hypothetical protein
MNANYNKYFEIWHKRYSESGFGCGNINVAAAYAAMDCMNQVKGWSQAEIDDDINYLAEKTQQAATQQAA